MKLLSDGRRKNARATTMHALPDLEWCLAPHLLRGRTDQADFNANGLGPISEYH